MTKKRIVIVILIILALVLISNYIFFELGNYYYGKGLYAKSIAMYDKVFINNNINNETLIKIGISQSKLKNYDKAIEAFDKIDYNAKNLKKYEKDIYYNKGICYYSIDNHELSASNLTRYIDLEENELLLKIICPYLLYSYYAQGKYDECIEYAAYFLSISDEDVPYKNRILNFKYDCYFKQKEYDLALDVNQEIINNEPNNSNNYLGNYLVYVETKGIEYAKDYLLELEKMFPNDDNLKRFLH